MEIDGLKPEDQARVFIDQKLRAAGWAVQNHSEYNPSEALGIALREHPTATGGADYILYIDRKAIGVIEAKRDGILGTQVEEQANRYAKSKLKFAKKGQTISFLFVANSNEIGFTDLRDPAPQRREIFHFFKPETLKNWLKQTHSLRHNLKHHIPALPTASLRECQINAIVGLEQSLAKQRLHALIHMATGAGKTYTAINAVSRLLDHGNAKRILFLVDTKNLGKQAEQEFLAFQPEGKDKLFCEDHIVQRLRSNTIDSAAEVCICTIQRMYSMLSGKPVDESLDDTPLSELANKQQAKVVEYNPAIPIETFDFIIVDECHRSIYNLWKQVLDYFDAFIIGLTATPDNRALGYFKENVVAEYSYEDSVIDGVNVGYDVYEIETEISNKGAKLKAKEWIDHRDKLTRKKRWALTEEDKNYTSKELDKSVVNTSQIRQVIKAMKKAVESEIFPDREETPKTLIFAKTDSHAEDIIKIVRDEYGQSNEFCKKITNKAKDPEGTLTDFRIDYNPRIAVTVDMIATGTDVKPLEVLLFMRDVRSKGYYEQMKGRGVRSVSPEELTNVSKSATTKERFVLIDAVGVEKSLKTESRQLECKPHIAMKELLQGVVMGERDDQTIQSLANRLIRLGKQLDPRQHQQLEAQTGKPIAKIAKELLKALDPDVINTKALADAKAGGKARNLMSLTDKEKDQAKQALVDEACQTFDNPKTRNAIESARRDREQLIDHINLDTVTYSGYSQQAQQNAEQTVQSFKAFIEQNKDEIQALGFFYQQPYKRRELTFAMLEQLQQQMKKPPLMLTTEKLWHAYERINSANNTTKSKKSTAKRQLTDIISLVKFAIGLESELKPFAEQVDTKFKDWIFRHNAQRASAFSEEQTLWLRLIKDHIASSCAIEKEDFELSPFIDNGGLQKVYGLFNHNDKNELDSLIDELNQELIA